MRVHYIHEGFITCPGWDKLLKYELENIDLDKLPGFPQLDVLKAYQLHLGDKVA